MKSVTLKILSLLCAGVLAALSLSACGRDPNVKQDEETAATYHVEKADDEEAETEREGYHAYGAGKTEPVMIGDVQVKVADFALRSYELAYMMAQKSFSTPTELPVDVAVQYAFTHVFFPDFHSINNKVVQYRSASADQIRGELKNQFGTDDFPITDSVLYNPGKEIFEMWIPEYGTNIYYHIDAVNIDGDEAEIITTFFNELKRETMLGRTHITVKVLSGKPVIRALTAE